MAFERPPVEVREDATTALSTCRREWDLGEKIIRFVAHVVPGNSRMLLSRSDQAFGATIDLNPRLLLVTSRLFFFLNRNIEVAIVNAPHLGTL